MRQPSLAIALIALFLSGIAPSVAQTQQDSNLSAVRQACLKSVGLRYDPVLKQWVMRGAKTDMADMSEAVTRCIAERTGRQRS
jgi:hypothetical protein